jgi:hypothetical protein
MGAEQPVQTTIAGYSIGLSKRSPGRLSTVFATNTTTQAATGHRIERASMLTSHA